MADSLSLHQTRPPAQVERVQLVGGPCDGQRLFAVVGAPVVLYVALRVEPVGPGRKKIHPFFGMPMHQHDAQAPVTHGLHGYTAGDINLAVYSPRPNPAGLWTPYLGFDGIVEIPAAPGDGPFSSETIHLDRDEDDDE
jgi:hypothetical protein